MLILKALSLGPIHGWGVAERIERLSDGVCAIQQGAVYPALQRLLLKGWVTAAWRDSDNGRRAAITGSRPAGAADSTIRRGGGADRRRRSRAPRHGGGNLMGRWHGFRERLSA